MFVSILFALLLSTYQTTPQDISPLVDVKILSELPLNRLLQVRSTFQEPKDDSVSEIDSSSPQALALQGKFKPTERGGGGGGGGHHYDESKKSGKKSVQSIFQLSVTTLAFLAFGGYLLCLLVQAIKGKEPTTMMAMNTATMAALLNSVATKRRRRRPPTRRPSTRRPATRKPPTRYTYKKSTRPKRDIWPNIDPERMYYVLLDLSEGYADYHTIDYRRFNYTKSHYFN